MGLRVEKASHAVYINGNRTPLRGMDFDLLVYIYICPWKICTRKQIIKEVLQEDY
jgi:DNA-binding response OmpR family regulator